MPKAYWIARIDVTDPETYKVYASGTAAAFQQYGATYLVRGGAFTAAEGQARSRNVVIEFPSYQAALDCYNSKEYQAARAHRLPAATSTPAREILPVCGERFQDFPGIRRTRYPFKSSTAYDRKFA